MIKKNRIFTFIFFTFLLSWGFDFILMSLAGSDIFIKLGMSPWGMMAPAFVTIILQLFFFKDSPTFYRHYKDKPRWILIGFLIIMIIYGIITIAAAVYPGKRQIIQGLGAFLLTTWTLLIFYVYNQSESASLQKIGLSLGNVHYGSRFLIGILVFFFIQTGFNLLLGLGESVGIGGSIYNLPIPSNLYIPSLIVLFIPITVIGLPLSGLAVVFGEEYGWRGFLLSELIKIGKLRGILLVGFVWGIWHFPIILRGVHTYPANCLGLFLGLIFFSLWGIIQGYAVIKTGSIWIAAFMHGLVNSVYSFSLTYIVKPESKIFSFGLGIYGLICMGIIVFFIFRDSIWKDE